MEHYSKDYKDAKNYLEIESVYDLIHQTIMDGKYKVYIKEHYPREPLPNEELAEILDIQED